jgi:hypothetical protein
MSRNLGALTLLDPSGPEWPVMGVLLPSLFTQQEKTLKLMNLACCELITARSI